MEPKAGILSQLSAIAVFIAGFIFGIFLASFVAILPLVSLLAIAVAGAILIAEKLREEHVSREIFLIALFIVALSLGTLRFAIKDFHITQTPAPTGVVIDEPLDTESVRRFTYEADNGEKVLVSVPLYTPVEYGDRVSVAGSLKEPGVIKGEHGARDFDYGAYLAKDDIYWTMSFAKVEALAQGEGNPVKASLLRVKNNFISHIEQILPEPQASLLAGLLVAGKGSLPARVLEDFRRAGVIHIVVLSGFNVTLIAEFLRELLVYTFLISGFAAAPLAAALVAAGGIILFVLMTGATATVVRAAVMAFILLLAKHLGRSFSAPRALALAAFLMLMVNPKLLVFDPSFELSFLATLGLIYLSPWVEEKVRNRWTKYLPLKEIFVQTVGTQLAVLPLLVYSTGMLSIVSLPANLAILPLVPFAMLVGFVATVLSYVSAILAWPLSLLTHLLLLYILAAAHFLGSLPFATLQVPAISGWALVALILIGSLLMLGWRSRNSLRPLSS